MPTIHTDSKKPKLGVDQSYPLNASDLEEALEPRVTGEIYLSLRFHPHQSDRKNERDRLEALGDFRLLECRYSRSGPYLDGLDRPDPPWRSVANAQVVLADVFAIPVSALTKGVGLQGPLGALLADGLDALAPKGIPSASKARNAWILELGLDARIHTVRSRLQPWNGAAYAVTKTSEFVLPPVVVRRRA